MTFTTDISSYRPKVSLGNVAKIITASTSGTTGVEKRVYYTENDLERTVQIFMRGISEMRPEKTLVAFPAAGLYSLGERIGEALRRLGACAVFTSPGMSYLSIVQLTEKEKPDSFIGFPQMLLALQRITGGCFGSGLISGDYCIKADYMCPVFPHYGSRETGLAGAISCRCRQGMHMRQDTDVLIVDESGAPVPPGTEGELIITTHLEAMPLDNYKTGDYTCIIPAPCPCGEDGVRIGSVRRRAEIEVLDDELFTDETLIDALVYRKAGELKVEKLFARDLKPDTRPFYPAKRTVLER